MANCNNYGGLCGNLSLPVTLFGFKDLVIGFLSFAIALEISREPFHLHFLESL